MITPIAASIELLGPDLSRQIGPWIAVLTMLLAATLRWTWKQKAFQYFCLGIFRLLYRIRVRGRENWPREGGAVLVANHSSWIDGVLMLIIAPRRTRMIAWSGNFNNAFMRWLARFADVILISGGPSSIRHGLETAREAVREGQVVGIFPEGGITRTGQIQSFKAGIMKVIDGTDVPVIPIYVDQIWGSIFTYSGGKAIWKWPQRLRRPVTINVGPPVPDRDSVFSIRQSLQQSGARAVSDRQPPFVAPAQSFIRSCKRQRFRFKAADSAGASGTGGVVLLRSLIARRLLSRHVLAADESRVGVLLPPSFGGVVINMALALDRRVAINLNYTVSNAILNHCIEAAGIRHVLTSRKVLEKLDFRFDCEVVCLEDLKDKVSLMDKLAGAAGAYAAPARLLERQLGLNRLGPDDLLTVIFTSGSTGTPKGVMLTQRNIASNVEAIDQVIKLKPDDVLLGILPFFHSFGYTVTLWGAMSMNIAAAYHFNPLDVMQIGKLCQNHGVSILLCTPTFLRSYLRKCTPEQFQRLDVAVAGAEKLPGELCESFEQKFGVRPVEGYGTTELSPLVSVNIPPSRRGDNYMVDCKEGTVGRPVPNVAARVTHVDTGEPLGANEEGTLWITGPNVMKGYLNHPEKTAEVLVDGWYNTGDVATIDEDGFIRITGRISRFSKIGGEMVPHVVIEDTLGSLLDEDEQDQMRFAVTAVPDPKKGERLIVLHTELRKTPSEYCEQMSRAGLPNLYIPAANSFYAVDEIPVLGTGKLDLRKVRTVAEELTARS